MTELLVADIGGTGSRLALMQDGQKMISLLVPAEGGRILSVSENGYGKRTELSEYATKGRGNKGMIFMQTSERNGEMIGVVQVFDGDELMMISDQGTMVRIRTDEISILGRNTQGVRVIRLKGGEHVVGVERIDEPDEIVVDIDATESE